MSVYIDTSAFYAVVDASDSNHQSAVLTWKHLLDRDEVLFTSNYVVAEMVALLHHRFGTKIVRRFVGDNLPAVFVRWVDQATHDAALGAMLSTRGKRGPSLVDYVSFETINRNKIDSVFAYDRRFEDRGFNLVGSQP
ncbi:MAG: PIN domain-containing protein [Armatimonadetes bacterium]|nr:PIN domain-containing protein [Armatimonadota bacterium]